MQAYPISASKTSLAPARLRKIVQSGCGKLAREVRVESSANHQMVVHVVAAPAKEQPTLPTAAQEIRQHGLGRIVYRFEVANFEPLL